MGLLPILALFFLVIGGIYGGIFTPTEAAGVGCTGVLLTAVMGRRLTKRAMSKALEETALISAMIFAIIVGGYLVARFLAITGLTEDLVSLLVGMELGRVPFLMPFSLYADGRDGLAVSGPGHPSEIARPQRPLPCQPPHVETAVVVRERPREKRTNTTDDGWPVHSLRTLLSEFGTRCKNTCRTGTGKNILRFEQLTEPSPFQQHVFSLLGLTPEHTVPSNPAT